MVDGAIEIRFSFPFLGAKMYHRYENSSNNSPTPSSGSGVFLGTAREKREKLLKKADLNRQRSGSFGVWKPHTPLLRSVNELSSPEIRHLRHHQDSRTHSVESISSSASTTTPTVPTSERVVPRTASQSSLHRTSPCSSDISLSYLNPKYFVRTATFRSVPHSTARAPLHYENVIVSD